MMNMMEETTINIESQEVLEQEPELKTKEQRQMELEQFNLIKKMVKDKRKYYKSNLFQIRKLDSNK